MGDYEKKSNQKGFRFLKITGDIFVINIEFLLTTVISLTFLFFPALFAMNELMRKEKESFVNPFKDYFLLIKKHFSCGYKYWITFLPLYALFSYLLYLDYQMIHNNTNILFAWLSLILSIGILFTLTTGIIQTSIYKAYFEDTSALLAFRKGSLIARKKILLTISIWLLILSFAFIFYMFYPLLFFFGIGLLSYLCILMSSRIYEKLLREEKARLDEEQKQ